MAIVIFFIAHWQLSVFFQSFFQHRYGAHRQFSMSKRTERVFHFLTWFVQGSSYLSPRAYAILHRMHHAYSDTEKDPHSPVHHPNLFKMMWRTKKMYSDIKRNVTKPEPRFDGDVPYWAVLDKPHEGWVLPLAWGALYGTIYLVFATHWWQFLLLPAHWLLGPIHGAIVNYCGHKLGYRNFSSDDASRNTLVFDVLTAGELFQNNHHKFGQSPNFAARWFEIDPTYQVMRVLHALKIIDMSGSQVMRYKAERPAPIPSRPIPSRAATPVLSPMDGE